MAKTLSCKQFLVKCNLLEERELVDFICFHCEDTTLLDVKEAVKTIDTICVLEESKFFFIGFSAKNQNTKAKKLLRKNNIVVNPYFKYRNLYSTRLMDLLITVGGITVEKEDILDKRGYK